MDGIVYIFSINIKSEMPDHFSRDHCFSSVACGDPVDLLLFSSMLLLLLYYLEMQQAHENISLANIYQNQKDILKGEPNNVPPIPHAPYWGYESCKSFFYEPFIYQIGSGFVMLSTDTVSGEILSCRA